MSGMRHKGRITALQVLYELDCTQHEAKDILSRLSAEKNLPTEVVNFSKKLVEGVIQNKSKLDDFIKHFAPAFPIEQMPVIDKNILRLAIFEALFSDNTPVKVAINEAVELAKSFGSDSSSRLINGVLGSVASKYSTKINK